MPTAFAAQKPPRCGRLSVSVSGGGGNCTITLASGSGSCSLTPTTLGSNQTWTASYTGDGAFGPSSGTATHTVNPAYTFTGFLNPLTTATVYPVANLSGSWTFSRVLPIKWQIKNASGTAVTSGGAQARRRV